APAVWPWGVNLIRGRRAAGAPEEPLANSPAPEPSTPPAPQPAPPTPSPPPSGGTVGAAAAPWEGRLLKRVGDPEVYLVVEGKLSWLVNELALRSHPRLTFGDVEELAPAA